MNIDPITAALDTFAATATLVGKALPSDTERLKRLEINHPWLYARALKRAEKQRAKQMAIQLKAMQDAANFAQKNGISAEALSMYLWSDTTKAEIIRQMLNKK